MGEWLSFADLDGSERLAPATSSAVDDYDFAIRIVLSQPDDNFRRLLWAAAHSAAFRTRGIAWRKLGKLRRCDPRRVKADYEKALLHTVLRWNAG